MITLKQTLLATTAASFVYVRFTPPELRYFSNDKVTVALFFAAAIFTKFVYEVFIYPFWISPIRNLPSPKTESYINGHFPSIRAWPTGIPHQSWIKLPNDGLIAYKSFFNIERVSPTTTASMAEVLVHKAYEFEKPWFMKEGIANVLGPKGLLFIEGEEHKYQRKHMLPAFSHRYLKQNLIPIFWSCGTTLADRLIEEYEIHPSSSAEKAFSPIIDLQEWCSRCTLDIIGQAGFGVSFNSMQKEGTELSRAYSVIFGKPGPLTKIIQIASFVVPTAFMYGLFRWIDEFKRFDQSMEMIRKATRQVIENKKEEIKKRGGKDAAAAMDGKSKNLLSIIMEEMDFPDDTLVDHTLTFLAAGHETTATALTWAIHQLIQHPEWQNLLRNEIRTHIASPTHSDLTPENLDSLPYLKAFTSEVLRLNSPVSLIFREASCDTTIAGHPVPKGCIVTLPILAFNRDEDGWGPNAKKFDPYRWLKKTSTSVEGEPQYHYDPSGGSHSNYNLMTFSQGPHNCIGKDFAREEFLCVLGALVGRFEFEGDRREPEIEFSITNKMRGGLPVKIRWVAGW